MIDIGLTHIALPVSDVEQSIEFYCKYAVIVLDLNCRTHDINNLYVVDGSFFPSSGAVNPTLTIIANALRVGVSLIERMK